MQNINDIISQMPSMARVPKQTSVQDQNGLVINQVIPAILQFIAREIPIKKDLEATQDLHKRLIALIDNLQSVIDANDTPKFTLQISESLDDMVKKLSNPSIDFSSVEKATKSVESAIKAIKFPSEFSVKNLSEVSDSVRELKPLLADLKLAIADNKTEVEIPENVILDKESKGYLKKLELLETDAKNPIAVRLSDGKEFYKGIGQLNEGIRAITGSSGNNFNLPNSSPTKANVDANANLKVVQDVYTVKIVYASAGKPQYIGKALPGTPASSAGWQIQKLTYSTDDVTDIQWASGSLEFTHVFNNYASYTYS